jgi:molybdopterin molybdotransferase
VEKCFHKVAQRPGKPFWFGHYNRRPVVFALPGNPVSAFLCTWRYLMPFLHHSLGQELPRRRTAVLSENVTFKPALTYFLPVKLDNPENGIIQAFPLPGHGSGDLANLNDADAFLELPLEQDQFYAGETFPVLQYRYNALR